MTAPRDNTPDGSSRIGGSNTGTTGRHGRVDPPASGTNAGADVHDRMTGRSDRNDYTDRDGDRNDRDRVDTGRMTGNSTVVTPTRGADETEHRFKPAKTSAAAAFALVFGLSALFCALTAILAPLGVLFGIIGLVLGVVGMKKAKLVGVTGKGVALGGLLTALLGLLLGGAVLAGAAVLVNSPEGINRVQTELDKLSDKLPSGSEVRSELPAG